MPRCWKCELTCYRSAENLRKLSCRLRTKPKKPRTLINIVRLRERLLYFVWPACHPARRYKYGGFRYLPRCWKCELTRVLATENLRKLSYRLLSKPEKPRALGDVVCLRQILL